MAKRYRYYITDGSDVGFDGTSPIVLDTTNKTKIIDYLGPYYTWMTGCTVDDLDEEAAIAVLKEYCDFDEDGIDLSMVQVHKNGKLVRCMDNYFAGGVIEWLNSERKKRNIN